MVRLDDARMRLPLEHTRPLLGALMNVTRHLRQEVGAMGFNDSWVLAWRTALWLLQRNDDLGARGALFLDALAQARDFAVAKTLLAIDVERRGKPDGKPRLFTDEDLEKGKVLWLKRFKTWLGDAEQALQHPQILSYLYGWRELTNVEEPSAWMEALVEDPASFVRVLRAFETVSTSQGFGDHVAQVHRRLNTNYLNDFVPLETAQRLAHRIDLTVLSGADRVLVETLLRADAPLEDEAG